MTQTQTNRRDGNGNPFGGALNGQCTYWAQQRYHQLTGIWSPCTGNGYQWASQAGLAGWIVGSQPPPNSPSIICLQPGTQGADRNFGHVGVVERVNGDGSVYTSNYNVYPNLNNKVVVYLTFHTGNGVSFIYAGNNIGSLSPLAKAVSAGISYATGLGATYALSSNATIAEFLSSMDSYLTLKNPFDVQAKQDTISAGPVNIGISDPVDWISQVSNNLVSDLIAIVLRSLLLLLGCYILFKILSHFIDFSAVAQKAGDVAMKVVPLLVA